jgi:hypothetical protein
MIFCVGLLCLFLFLLQAWVLHGGAPDDLYCCRLSAQALADLCVARQLYSSTVMRIKQQRQLLVLHLQQLLDRYTDVRRYKTDNVFHGVAGALLTFCCWYTWCASRLLQHMWEVG